VREVRGPPGAPHRSFDGGGELAAIDIPHGAASLSKMRSLLRKVDHLIDHLPTSPRLFRFCVVGASGVVVNLAVLGTTLALLPTAWGLWQARTAQAAGILGSILTNFLLNDRWTWADSRSDGTTHWLRRLGRFCLVSAVAALLQWGSSIALHEGLGLWIYLAQALGIVLAMGFNFTLNHRWTFRRRSASAGDGQAVPPPHQ
jgi:dolichol-phosphate mannosyltransferase